MKNFYKFYLKKTSLALFTIGFTGLFNLLMAQTATVSVPVGLGSPCNVTFTSTANDSVKLFRYNAATNLLTHRSNCQPILTPTPGFRDDLTGITYNPFDGNYYLQRIALSGSIYSTHIFRWNPTTCPGPTSLAAYAVFYNQFVVGLEFDPSTGLGYQLNFIDTTGVQASNVDATGNVGQYSSPVILNSGRPAVAYYDGTNNDLKYARAKDIDGTDWFPPITVTAAGNVGSYVAMAIVNGNPAISYYDITNGNLMYVRATDADGTAWGAPVTVDASAGNVGQFTSLKVVNGNPAIAYYDVTNGDLKYVRATDANGTAWAASLAIATTGNVGQYASMDIINGNPAVSYYNVTNGDLEYVRATNVNGTAWGVPVVVEATNNIGQFASMKIINGNPAISYFDVTNNDLRYIRASNVDGTAWAAPVAVATAGNVGSHTSLQTISGNPAIAYYDITNGDLKYVRATDASGTVWAAPVSAEAGANNIGQFAQMLVVNGNPAIAYYDVTNGDPKFIRSYDNTGIRWYRNTGVYNMHLQRINFTTGVIEESKRVNYGNRYIYNQSGDLVLTPDGKYLSIFNNKYFSINWQNYDAGSLVATHIDTVILPANERVVGLAYADGKLVASVSNSSTRCSSNYKEVDINSGAISNITYNASTNLFVSADMTNIPTGIGASKKLLSSTAVGGGTYDLVYEIYVKNYGGNPVTGVQLYDTLSNINGGAGNILSRSISSFTAPAGFSANPLYTGTTAGGMNLFLAAGTLSNIPGQNEIRVQITVRVANIVPGIIYYNQATVTATNLFGDALRDLSTNGDHPDKNNNAKPDDAGESEPTPFLVQLAGSTSPCLTLTKVLFSQNFGVAASATALSSVFPAPVLGTGVSLPVQQSGFTPVTVQPLDVDQFTLTANTNNANNSRFINRLDNTPADVNGQAMVINADVDASKYIYRGGFTFPLCANQQYSLSFYSVFTGNPSYDTICRALNPSGQFVYPNLLITIRDGATGTVITQVSTGNIMSNNWQQYGVKFLSPASYSSIIFELTNDADGGCGNDLAIDDIQFGSCDPTPVVGVSTVTGCLGNTSTLSGSLSDPGAISGTPQYQWEVGPSATGPWTTLVNGGNISGATTQNLVINPLAAADTGKYYRLLVSAMGNIGDANCRFNSPATLLAGKAPSVAPASATRNKNNICSGITVQLGLSGGTLGTGATWRWYTGSPGGTLIGSGTTLNVAPTVTTTYYVRAEGDCNTTTDASVTVTVNCDIDKDNDGIPDFVESNMAAAFADANANTVINAYDPTYAGFVDYNNDYVNDNFQADGDSDNDGIPNYLDATFAGRVDANSDGVDDRFDQDRDGVINMLDLDSDNDGVPDVVEAWGVDTNGDGRIDNLTDTDADGLSDNVDTRIIAADGAYNTGVGLGLINIDGDALSNFLDLDSDNDGIPDIREALGTDADNDGKADGFTDVNTDGLHDAYISAGALLLTGTDGGGDGRADSWPNKNLDRDLRPNAYDLDSDGDGIADVIEAGGGITDADLNGLADGALVNGWSSTVDALPALNLRNTEGVGNPDYLDIDSDEDGIPDNIEGMSTAGYQLPTTTDTDGDGLCSPYDNLVGFGGSGIFVYDHDGDGTPDYRDLDTDSDGALDLCEGNDWSLDGVCNEPLTLSGLDADGDGLDNIFDSLNSVTNLKGTSYMMGNGGSFTGDATPGTKATVQRTTVTQGDRDWRWAATVLPVQFLGFTGVMQNAQVNLNWTIVTAKAIDRFEVERSTDNSSFTKVGTVTDAVQLNMQQVFGLTDDVANINSEVFYYRLKAISKTGEWKYSNVLVVRKSNTKTPVTVMPNPANDYVTVRFFVEKESEVTIRLVDNIGKTIILQKQKAAKGTNAVQLNNLAKYSNGVYSVQVLVNGEVVTQKIILSH